MIDVVGRMIVGQVMMLAIKLRLPRSRTGRQAQHGSKEKGSTHAATPAKLNEIHTVIGKRPANFTLPVAKQPYDMSEKKDTYWRIHPFSGFYNAAGKVFALSLPMIDRRRDFIWQPFSHRIAQCR
ncbi:hypothetical protein HNR62_003203 [Oceanisphaera litoralis]|uniref:hypothetical protein n=1 Tax=Oceanisphaera litoralis TaxID=225144 RepID=UPI001EF94080|nr:hypothetical protein [Oceanisphaera litoralis]MBM7457291.1 hypothetical protein [Oceanisphaera litoralis]